MLAADAPGVLGLGNGAVHEPLDEARGNRRAVEEDASDARVVQRLDVGVGVLGVVTMCDQSATVVTPALSAWSAPQSAPA